MLRKLINFCELLYVGVHSTSPYPGLTKVFLVVEAGGKLGEAQSAPWRKLANVLAINHLQIFNWSPDCPYLPNTTGAKGIEGAHTHGLRALVGQFLDKDMPVRIQKINDLGHQQGMCLSKFTL